jgi:opacity protein-like surface antigen
MRTRSANSVHDRLVQGFGVTLLVSILIIICAPRTVYAQAEHPVTVSFGAGVTPLVGRISNSLDNGWHITVGGGVNITRHFQAALEYGYNGYGVGQKLLSEAKVPEGNSHLWWLTANPKLRFKPIHTVDPYVVGGVGYYRRTMEFTTPATVSVFIFDPIFGTFFNVLVPAHKVLGDITDGGVGGSLGAGMDFKLGDSGLKFFTEARYHYADTGRVPTRMVPVTFGVRW